MTEELTELRDELERVRLEHAEEVHDLEAC